MLDFEIRDKFGLKLKDVKSIKLSKQFNNL